MKRLLVTGSRNWDEGYILSLRYGQALGYLHTPLDEIVTVHGGARGVDGFISSLAAFYRYPQEVHVAKWEEFGRRAGMVRNQWMVDKGADLCIAFIAQCDQQGCDKPQPHGSHGATGCADLAEQAGIETWRFYADDSLGVSTVPPLGGAQTA